MSIVILDVITTTITTNPLYHPGEHSLLEGY